MRHLISLESVAALERSDPDHGSKGVGLRIAEMAGHAVPAYSVASGDPGWHLDIPDPPLIVRNSPILPWIRSDEVSGEGVSVVCQTTSEVELALAGQVAPSTSSSTIIQRYILALISGFIHSFPRGLMDEAGQDALGVVCWTHGTGASIAFGADDPPHFVVISDGSDIPALVLSDADFDELERVGRTLRQTLCSTINLLRTDVPLELEWVWDGDRLWIVQLQPLDLEHSNWPYLSRRH